MSDKKSVAPGKSYTQNTRKPQGGHRREEVLPEQACAPYNFVPLSNRVVFPDLDNNDQGELLAYNRRVSHDLPFRDGISGHLDIEIRAASPLFIRDSQQRDQFFRLPGDIRAIPGTSLRGMLRSVVEIASFGKMGYVNDHTYGVRDLHNRDLYGQHMSEIIDGPGGQKQPVPLVNAGWLSQSTDSFYDSEGGDGSPVWKIEPCHFARVEYGLIEAWADKQGISNYEPGRKQSAPDKYRRWRDDQREVAALVRVERQDNSSVKGRPPCVGKFGKVTELLPVGSTPPQGKTLEQGTLIFTGQPSEFRQEMLLNKRPGAGNPKHHDFFFYGSTGDTIKVPWSVRKAFEFVHSDTGEQHRLELAPNEEWGFWKKRLEKGERIPIFFLREPDTKARGWKLRAMGLAMMFRLAYAHSTHDTVEHTQPEAFVERPDIPELIFGRVEHQSHQGKFSYRGRVSIETAVELGKANTLAPITTVLGGPKASYYPNYIEQAAHYGSLPDQKDNKYYSYMDPKPKSRVRGWKRYVQRKRVMSAPPLPRGKDGNVNTSVGTTFTPLSAGARFTTRIHVHNLRPFELGALLWALDFGGRNACFHGLGMAKSLGYGKVLLSVHSHHLLDVRRNKLSELATIRADYEAHMEQHIPGWAQSPQIQELIALATEVSEERSEDLRHMQISHPAYRNEFQAVKKAGLALLSHSQDTREAQSSRDFMQTERKSLRDREQAADAQYARELALRTWQKEQEKQTSTESTAPSSRHLPASSVPAQTSQPTKVVDPQQQEWQRILEEVRVEFAALDKQDRLTRAMQWISEDKQTPLDQARRSVLNETWKDVNKNWRQKNPEIARWMKEE